MSNPEQQNSSRESPSQFLQAWRSRLRRHSMIRGAVMGVVAGAAALCLSSLLSFFFFPSSPLAGPMLPALGVLLVFLGAAFGSLIAARPSKFPLPGVARAADLALPESRGRLAAWVDLQHQLPTDWHRALQHEICTYLGRVSPPPPEPPHRLLLRAGTAAAAFVFLACLPGWWKNHEIHLHGQTVNEARQILASARAMVQQQKETPAEPENTNLHSELLSLLGRATEQIQGELSGADAVALARGTLAQVELKLRENQPAPAPWQAADSGTDRDHMPGVADTVKDAVFHANQVVSGLSIDNSSAPRLDSAEAGAGSPRPENTPLASTPSLFPFAETGSLQPEGTVENDAVAALATELPEGVTGRDTSGPAVDSGVGERPGEEPLTGGGVAMELPGYLPAETAEAVRSVLRLATRSGEAGSTDGDLLLLWNQAVEDARQERVPAGSRETVRRYFERLRLGD